MRDCGRIYRLLFELNAAVYDRALYVGARVQRVHVVQAYVRVLAHFQRAHAVGQTYRLCGVYGYGLKRALLAQAVAHAYGGLDRQILLGYHGRVGHQRDVYAGTLEACGRGKRHVAQFGLGAVGQQRAQRYRKPRLSQTVGEEEITALERLIDRNMAESGPLKQFVIPGRNLASAQLHVARTQSRRLERLLTAMDRAHPLRDALKRYSNRLSDALFSMARIEETRPDACA